MSQYSGERAWPEFFGASHNLVPCLSVLAWLTGTRAISESDDMPGLNARGQTVLISMPQVDLHNDGVSKLNWTSHKKRIHDNFRYIYLHDRVKDAAKQWSTRGLCMQCSELLKFAGQVQRPPYSKHGLSILKCIIIIRRILNIVLSVISAKRYQGQHLMPHTSNSVYYLSFII